MFTQATKKFGVWKEERKNNKMLYLINSRQVMFSISMAAFISLIFFIITIKLRQEFFLIESAPITYMKLDNIKNINTGFFFNERKSALTVYVSKNKSNNLKIIFDTGKTFTLPTEAAAFIDYFESKRQNIMLTSMLMRIEDRSISRVKIWTDKSISFKNIRYIVKIFSQFGYDDFDFAVER